MPTPALTALTSANIDHRVIRHGPVSSLEEAAAARGVEIPDVVKTIVVRRSDDDYYFVLVPGGRAISWPKLRTLLDVNRLSMPDAATAKAVTGYERGTITPFGSATPWPVIADAAIPSLERVAIGGGGHGVNLHLSGSDLVRFLSADVAEVTRPDEPRPAVA